MPITAGLIAEIYDRQIDLETACLGLIAEREGPSLQSIATRIIQGCHQAQGDRQEGQEEGKKTNGSQNRGNVPNKITRQIF